MSEFLKRLKARWPFVVMIIAGALLAFFGVLFFRETPKIAMAFVCVGAAILFLGGMLGAGYNLIEFLVKSFPNKEVPPTTPEDLMK